MKRHMYLLCLLVLMSAFLCSCGNTSKDDADDYRPGEIVQLSEEPVFDYKSYDWVTLLRQEAFDAGSTLGDAALNVLEIQVDDITESNITVTVTAPHIFEELSQWYTANDADETALESQILTLLQGEKQEGTFTLNYYLTDEMTPVVDYTESYAKVVTCGLMEFTSLLQENIVKEMGGGLE